MVTKMTILKYKFIHSSHAQKSYSSFPSMQKNTQGLSNLSSILATPTFPLLVKFKKLISTLGDRGGGMHL